MLTTAAILMSLGTEPINVRHAPSDRVDDTEISFAKSFDESSVLAGEVEASTSKGTKLKAEVDDKSSAPAKVQGLGTVSVQVGTKADESAVGKVQSESGETKSLPSSGHGSGSSIAEGITATATNGKTNTNPSTPLQVKSPDGQDSAVATTRPAQQAVPKAIDGSNVGTADEAANAQTEIAASVTPSILVKDVKSMIENQNEIPVLDKNQKSTETKKVAKDHDGLEKSEKAKNKEEKTNAVAVAAGNVIGTAPPAAIVTPVLAPSLDKQQRELSLPNEDASSSITSARTGQSIGIRPDADGKADKKIQAGKTDGDSTKTAAPASMDDSSSRKVGADVSKAGSSTASTTDDGSAKEQGVATVVASARATPVEPGMTGVVSGGVAVGAAAHVVADKAQQTETSSHGIAAQSGSDAMDGAAPPDAMHKTLMATPTSLEVGVANGTHGWLKIRAEMTGGGVVNASLSTATSSGQEMLHRELPSLTAYLQSERVAVNTVVVQSAASAGADPRGFTGGMPGDGREQAQQGGGQGGESRQGTASSVPNQFGKGVPYNGINEVGGDELLSSVSYTNGGSWLNVRA